MLDLPKAQDRDKVFATEPRWWICSKQSTALVDLPQAKYRAGGFAPVPLSRICSKQSTALVDYHQVKYRSGGFAPVYFPRLRTCLTPPHALVPSPLANYYS